MTRRFRTAPTAQRRAVPWPAAGWAALALAFAFAFGGPALAQDNPQDLAKQLANPIADLVSVPIQYNYLQGFQPNDGRAAVTNIQPVIPFSIGENWNVISRTILPVIDANNIGANPDSAFGIGNITQSFFFSPKKPTDFGLIWGVGMVLTLPTSSDDVLGPDQWGAGVTAVGLMQKEHWTFGALWNHVWSVNNDQEFGASSTTLFQPFASYIKKDGTTFTIESEATYDWEDDELTLPITAAVYKLVKVGKQRIQIGGGPTYFAASPDGGPEGWGLRVQATLLFPKQGG